ncbi:MAG: MFS transporter [Candidatus Humimicrobiaceae bacterium]
MPKNNFSEVKQYLLEFPNFLSIFLFALFFLLASPILLDISKDTGLEAGNLSLIFTLYTVGGITGQLTSVFYSRTFKRLNIILAGYFILLPITTALYFTQTLIIFYILYFLAGYILGLIWIQVNINIFESVVKNKDRLTTMALTFYPIGAFFAPMIASFIVKNNFNWRHIYGVIILFIIITIILFIFITRKRKYFSKEGGRKTKLREVFSNKLNNILLLIISASIITYCLAETVISTWSPTFFRLARSFDVQSAGLVVSVFWISIIIGRGIVSSLTGRVNSSYIMLGLAIIAIISTTFAIYLDSTTLIFITIFIAGLGFSGLFPLLISSGNKIFNKGKDLIATILFASTNIGISLAPFLTKIISNRNLKLSVLISVIFMGITFLLVLSHFLVKKINIKNQL